MACLMKEWAYNDEFSSCCKENSISHVLANTVSYIIGILCSYVFILVPMVYAYGILFEYGWFCGILEVGVRGSDYCNYTFIMYKC